MSRSRQYSVTFWLSVGVFWIAHLAGPNQLNSTFSPDTNSFYELSKYRQPLYGYWMQGAFSMLSTWTAVKSSQLILYCLAVSFLASELHFVSRFGRWCALTLLVALLILKQTGMTGYIASLISEGFFYTGLITTFGLLIRSLRLGSLKSFLLFLFVSVLLSQLKTAYLPVLCVQVIFLAGYWVRLYRSNEKMLARPPLLVTSSFLLMLILMPAILGKGFLELSTESNRIGFVIAPRIAMLETPPHLLKELEGWDVISSPWRGVTKGLSILPYTQFDAHIQETVRYELYPRNIISIKSSQPSPWASSME